MAAHRILVTGANGYVGSHILRQLLAKPDCNVRAVVRSHDKVAAVKRDFSSPNLDFAIVPDITIPGAFDEALSQSDIPFDAVIHTASPFLYKVVTDNHQFLDPAIKGTTGILQSVKDVAPSVRRVVITSSFAAVGSGAHPDVMRGRTVTEDDWNVITWDEAVAGSKSAGYLGSKKFAELAAWKFLKNESPAFDIVTICPPMIYGPLAHTVSDPSQLNESTARIYNLFINAKKEESLPPDALYLYADVRDVAAAHITALSIPEAGNNRFLVCAGQIPSQSISDILRTRFPELEQKTPVGKPGTNSLPKESERYNASSIKARRVLGLKMHSLEATIEDLGKQLIELDQKALHA